MIRKRASLKIRYDTVMITACGRELEPFPITGRAPTPAVTESSNSPEFSVTEPPYYMVRPLNHPPLTSWVETVKHPPERVRNPMF